MVRIKLKDRNLETKFPYVQVCESVNLCEFGLKWTGPSPAFSLSRMDGWIALSYSVTLIWDYTIAL